MRVTQRLAEQNYYNQGHKEEPMSRLVGRSLTHVWWLINKRDVLAWAPHWVTQPRAHVLGVPITSGFEHLRMWSDDDITSERVKGKWETKILFLKGLRTKSLVWSYSSEAVVREVWSYGERLNWLTLGQELEGQGLVGTLSRNGSTDRHHCSFVELSTHPAGQGQADTKSVVLHWSSSHHSPCSSIFWDPTPVNILAWPVPLPVAPNPPHKRKLASAHIVPPTKQCQAQHKQQLASAHIAAFSKCIQAWHMWWPP